MTSEERVTRLASRPAFIVGAPRSGTTWLQRMLLHHPKTCGGQESHWFVHLDAIARESRRKLAMPRPHGVLCHLDEDAFRSMLRRTWIEVATPSILAAPEATLLVEKSPDHVRHLDLIDELLPESRVIHLLRHPEAVVASLLAASRTDWGRPWAPRSVDAAAKVWIDSVIAAESSRDRFGSGRFASIRHDDLVRSPRETLRRVLDFLELEADDEIVTGTIAANTLEEARRGGGTTIALRGAAGHRPLEEPRGFHADRDARGLTWRERRRCRRLTGDLACRLGLDRANEA